MNIETQFEEKADKIAEILQKQYNVSPDEIVNIYAFIEAYKYVNNITMDFPNCYFIKKTSGQVSFNKNYKQWDLYLYDRRLKKKYFYSYDNINDAIMQVLGVLPCYSVPSEKDEETIERDRKMLKSRYEDNLKSFELMLPVVYRFRYLMNSSILKLFKMYDGNLSKYLGIYKLYNAQQ